MPLTLEAPTTAPTRLRSQAMCGTGTVVIWDPVEAQLTLIPCTCKSWDCPDCGPKKQSDWAKRLASGNPYLGITLTSRWSPGMDPYTRAVEMKAAFAKLVARIRRKFGWFEYAAVWELTKNRGPHLHVMARGPFIPQDWLSKTWCALTGAYIVDIRRIADPRTQAYHDLKSTCLLPQDDPDLGPLVHRPNKEGQFYSPERLASKQTSQSAALLAPLRIIQLSKNYEHPPGQPLAPAEPSTTEVLFCVADIDSAATTIRNELHIEPTLSRDGFRYTFQLSELVGYKFDQMPLGIPFLTPLDSVQGATQRTTRAASARASPWLFGSDQDAEVEL